MRNFSGKLDTFKILLDNYLDLVPDEPVTQTLSPSVVDYYGKPSNSLYDGCKNNSFNWKSPIDLNKIDNFYVIKPRNDTGIESVEIY